MVTESGADPGSLMKILESLLPAEIPSATIVPPSKPVTKSPRENSQTRHGRPPSGYSGGSTAR